MKSNIKKHRLMMNLINLKIKFQNIFRKKSKDEFLKYKDQRIKILINFVIQIK